MKTIMRDSHSNETEFSAAKQLAEETAAAQLDEPILLSWYDKKRDKESPSGVSECHTDCDVPGCIEYAQSRGGHLVVDIDQGDFLFCYRELGEFADH